MPKFPSDFGTFEYNNDNKARFLRAGSSLIKDVAKKLVEKGVAETYRTHVNRGGIAVSGDVYGYIYAPGLQHGVLIVITEGRFSRTRRDRLVCYLQYRTVNSSFSNHCDGKPSLPNLSRDIGSNVYVDPIDVDPITQAAERMLTNFPATISAA